jgi:poly-gamma-glutamate synthesis protein (capsule biosynthesis protein)
MVNLESAVTDSTCPEPQNKQYIFDAPATAITALKSASISLVSEGNDHGFDCGPQGLSQNLTIASQDQYPVIGIGNNSAQAFTPYRVTLDGQRIAIIAATQVITSNLVSTWTASPTQPGVASAIDPTALVREVQAIRKTADTVIVYLHWGTETQSCPNAQQPALAKQLVNAGADIVVGTNAHVLSGAGYLGTAYVAYGLGNFAFYDTNPPETDSGALIISAQGRRITNTQFRPATLQAGLPQPLSGQPATAAIQSWNQARSCTNLTATPSTSQTTLSGESRAFVAPPTTTTTSSPTGTAGNTGSSTTSSTTVPSSSTTSTTTHNHATTTTTPASTTTSPTDNAGGLAAALSPPSRRSARRLPGRRVPPLP